jgi:hypothetical protein
VIKLRSGALHYTTAFTVTLLAIEFLDELVFDIRETAWPLMRTDLGLACAQIGLPSRTEYGSLDFCRCAWSRDRPLGSESSGTGRSGRARAVPSFQRSYVESAGNGFAIPVHP